MFLVLSKKGLGMEAFMKFEEIHQRYLSDSSNEVIRMIQRKCGGVEFRRMENNDYCFRCPRGIRVNENDYVPIAAIQRKINDAVQRLGKMLGIE